MLLSKAFLALLFIQKANLKQEKNVICLSKKKNRRNVPYFTSFEKQTRDRIMVSLCFYPTQEAICHHQINISPGNRSALIFDSTSKRILLKRKQYCPLYIFEIHYIYRNYRFTPSDQPACNQYKQHISTPNDIIRKLL